MWRFIPKRAPWYGGFWERLIGLTKMSLKKVLGRAYVSLIMLQTLVVEVEATLNDRPLTHVSCDITDAEPITPAHLLYGRRITSLPFRQVEDDEVVDPTFGEGKDGAMNSMLPRRMSWTGDERLQDCSSYVIRPILVIT